MRIAIIGIGAMGSLFAARLSAIADIVMVGNWPEQLAALQKGLIIIAPDGKKRSYKIAATNKIQEIAPVNMVLVLVKSYQTERAARQAAMLLSGENSLNLALTLQNGAGNQEKLDAILGTSRVFAGVTSQAATIVAPGVVQDTGPGAIHLGSLPEQDEKVRKLAELFSGAGFEAHFSKDIRSLIWGKLAVNAGINTLTAILNRENGYIGENGITRKLMFQLAHETARVAAVQHIKMPYSNIENHMMEVTYATRNNRSSMLRDVLRHSQTEIEAICGMVIKKGIQYGVPTPVNKIIFDLVKEIEQGKRKPDRNIDLSRIVEDL